MHDKQLGKDNVIHYLKVCVWMISLIQKKWIVSMLEDSTWCYIGQAILFF